jgi:endonuclease YncB( thermonuclease family)
MIAANTGAAQQIRAIDGDTLALGLERIRVIGVDTPEIGHRARCTYERDLGERAKRFTADAVTLHAAVIERKGWDRYRRTLAHVYIDGASLAVMLIEAGLGKPTKKRRVTWC